MGAKLSVLVPSSDITLEDLQRIEREEPRQTAKPNELALSQIYVADKVFQVRLIERSRAETLDHIRTLVSALKAQESPFEPMLVVPIGQRFFVVDGHHRLGAYQSAKWTKPVPVVVFPEDLRAAKRQALELNVRNKLPVDKESKQEAAWNFVKEGTLSKSEMVKSTTVSEGIISQMKRVLKEYGDEARDLPWTRARLLGLSRQEAQEDWREQKTEWFKNQLVRTIAKDILKYPDLFADALDLMDPQLTKAMIEHWSITVRELFEDLGEPLDI